MEVEGYFLGDADVVTVESTSEDIGRYIEGVLRQDLEKSMTDGGLQADVRRVILKRGLGGVFINVRC